jgi:hypothetical protein
MPSTATRFDLAREKLSRFIVYRLIYSTTLPQTRWLSRGLNTRPLDLQSDAITLRCQVMLPYRKEGAKRLITLVTGSAYRSIRLRSKNSSYDRLAMTTKVIQRGVFSWGARTHDHWLKRPALCRGRLSAVARFFIIYRGTEALAQTVVTNFESKLIAGIKPATYLVQPGLHDR